MANELPLICHQTYASKVITKNNCAMNTKRFLSTLLVGFIGGLMALGVFLIVDKKNLPAEVNVPRQPAELVNYSGGFETNFPDFTIAAAKTVHGVVHVKTTQMVQQNYHNPFFDLFGYQQDSKPEPMMGFGSGVIISPDGYIVTNNHVIDGAETITVVLNDNREFEAKLVGKDPSTDIALLKVDNKDLPTIPWGNSDALKLGEWVLAVGNPFNLTSTVTAGIVSAKGRSLGILGDNYRIESFIQTDAALNKGNSGGALVNTDGELVGITSAIVSPSGAYAGNSFAIPVTIVKKVVNDLIEFGEVQRALLGVNIADVTAEVAKDQGLDKIAGVFITGVIDDGAAADAGIKKNDVILSINDIKVNSTSELQEQVGRYRPGEKLNISLLRDNKEKQIEVVLRNMQGSTSVVKKEEVSMVLGATVAPVNEQDKQKLGLKNGIRVLNVGTGKFQTAGIRNGFIITRVNNKPVNTAAELTQVISEVKGGVYIEGVYPNGMIAYYAFGL
jgi:Do/DeqQ family serine protease